MNSDLKRKEHIPLSQKEEEVGKAIVDAAFAVHKTLGPGLLEKVYEACFCHELNRRGLAFKRQLEIPIDTMESNSKRDFVVT